MKVRRISFNVILVLLALCAQAFAQVPTAEPSAEVRQAASRLAGTVLVGLGGDGLSDETTFDTDHGHFMLAGIPALDLWVDMTHYGEIHHKASDTVEKVNGHDLAAGAAVVAVTAYTIADATEAFASHADHKTVGEILKKVGVDELLISVGVWKP
jgi:hypothetical protein